MLIRFFCPWNTFNINISPRFKITFFNCRFGQPVLNTTPVIPIFYNESQPLPLTRNRNLLMRTQLTILLKRLRVWTWKCPGVLLTSESPRTSAFWETLSEILSAKISASVTLCSVWAGAWPQLSGSSHIPCLTREEHNPLPNPILVLGLVLIKN